MLLVVMQTFSARRQAVIELTVDNMTCAHCVSTVTRTLKALDPQASVDIDLEAKRVRVESREPREMLARALSQAGYPAT